MQIEDYIQNLKLSYKNKPLPEQISKKSKEFYKKCLNSYYQINGDEKQIVTWNYIYIAKKYNKIVITDYGPFLEIKKENVFWENLMLKNQQSNTNFIFYGIENYPNFECFFTKESSNVRDFSPNCLYIPTYKVFPVDK